ncbi:hypothetical protein AA14337_3364 [Acetobacter malorum DSM 14337]|uniref:Uncharacterized protein n=2 Tax=Acetobacter malorum TaxID=178901 RepID=A0ABQ0Q153_9PROT|nr:hypothetical protein AA14337_3364 [Acetobacter malorum DSM 14337]
MTNRISDDLRAQIGASAPVSPHEQITVAEEGIPVVMLMRDPSAKTGFDETLERVGTAVGVCSGGLLVFAALLNSHEELDPIVNMDLEAEMRNVMNASALHRNGDNVRLVVSRSLPGVTAYISNPAESKGERELFLTSVSGEITARSIQEFIPWARKEVEALDAEADDGDED